MRRLSSLTLTAALLAGAACGNLTMGGFGEAVVVVSGDAPDTLVSTPNALVPQVARIRAEPAGGWEPASGEDDEPEGQLEAEMRLFLISEGGARVSLSDDELEVRVDLQGVEQDETLPQEVPADSYDRLQIVFLQIEAQVDAGLVIGGDTITGPIDIDIEGDSLIVEKPLILRVDEGARTEIFIDLNAASWLQAVDPATLTVSAETFATLITIEAR